MSEIVHIKVEPTIIEVRPANEYIAGVISKDLCRFYLKNDPEKWFYTININDKTIKKGRTTVIFNSLEHKLDDIIPDPRNSIRKINFDNENEKKLFELAKECCKTQRPDGRNCNVQ